MTAILKNECGRLYRLRLHWPPFFPPSCIQTFCHMTQKFLTLEVAGLLPAELRAAPCDLLWPMGCLQVWCNQRLAADLCGQACPSWTSASAIKRLTHVDCWSQKKEENVNYNQTANKLLLFLRHWVLGGSSITGAKADWSRNFNSNLHEIYLTPLPWRHCSRGTGLLLGGVLIFPYFHARNPSMQAVS